MKLKEQGNALEPVPVQRPDLPSWSRGARSVQMPQWFSLLSATSLALPMLGTGSLCMASDFGSLLLFSLLCAFCIGIGWLSVIAEAIWLKTPSKCSFSSYVEIGRPPLELMLAGPAALAFGTALAWATGWATGIPVAAFAAVALIAARDPAAGFVFNPFLFLHPVKLRTLRSPDLQECRLAAVFPASGCLLPEAPFLGQCRIRKEGTLAICCVFQG